MTVRGLFVTGTDTGVGKTTVARRIVRLLRNQGHPVGVLKPVATGSTRAGEGWSNEDTSALIDAAGGEIAPDRVTPLHFEAPLAPCVAARVAGQRLESSRIQAAVDSALAWWSERAEIVIVEGIGGLLCPLAEGTTVADLAIVLDYPLVIVARRGLGTLNHTLLTTEAARARGLRIAGLVLNTSEPTVNPLAEATNAEELARRLPGVPILGDLGYETGRSAKSPSPGLAAGWELATPDSLALPEPLQDVDWYERARPPRRLGPRDPGRSDQEGLRR